MKRIYSIFMMLAMIVAASCFTACSSGDDDGIYGGDDRTLFVDGNAYYPDAVLSENYSYGIHLNFTACKNSSPKIPQYQFKVYIRGHKWVSELQIGETLNYNELYIHKTLYDKNYNLLSGSITIISLDNFNVKIKFNDLVFAPKSSDPSNPNAHTVSGTATFHNSLYKDGGYLPFGQL